MKEDVSANPIDVGALGSATDAYTVDEGQERPLISRAVGEARRHDHLGVVIDRYLAVVALVEAWGGLHDPTLGVREVILRVIGWHAEIAREWFAPPTCALISGQFIAPDVGPVLRILGRIARRQHAIPDILFQRPRDLRRDENVRSHTRTAAPSPSSVDRTVDSGVHHPHTVRRNAWRSSRHGVGEEERQMAFRERLRRGGREE